MKELWAKINEWWIQLGLRERRMVLLGSVVLSVFIIYEWIWSPFLEYVNQMRNRMVTEQKTLNWMQAADKQIQKLGKSSQTKLNSPVQLLSHIQKQINHAHLDSYLTLLKQDSKESVSIHFQRVEFESLMNLLIVMMKEKQIIISRLTLTAVDMPGYVNADIVVK